MALLVLMIYIKVWFMDNVVYLISNISSVNCNINWLATKRSLSCDELILV